MGKFALIALEGLDCSGKTTISRILAERLAPATILRFPDRETPTGQVLSKFLKKEEGSISLNPYTLHMLFSANRYEKTDIIKKALEKGNVICDRYWISGTAYSVSKGLDMDWCISTDRFLTQPDYTFFLDVDESVVASRPSFGEEAHDRICFQKKVYEIYQRKEIADRMIKIKADRGVEQIVSDILNIITQKY